MASILLRVVAARPLTNTEIDNNFSALNNEKVERDGSIPMTGKFVLVAGDADNASLRVQVASADPDTPEVGDMWFIGNRIKVRDGTGTKSIAWVEDGGTGFTGSQGFTGSAGTNGFTGSAGPIGFVGSAGTAGATGFTGSRGTVPVTISTATPSGSGTNVGDLWAQVEP